MSLQDQSAYLGADWAGQCHGQPGRSQSQAPQSGAGIRLQHDAASRSEQRCAAVGCKSCQRGAAGRKPGLVLLAAGNAEGLA